jgi:broad specificity phosphatase PhoE
MSPLRPSALLVVVALLASVGLAACGTGAVPTVRTASDAPLAASATSLVMIIRHGEKPDGDEPGVDADGNDDDSSLTRTGWTRARGLVDLFDPAQAPTRPGLARPATIYAAGATDDGQGARTRETVAPLAAALGLGVNTRFGKGDEKELVADVLARPGPTLISWQHGEIPTIVEAFPAVTPTPPAEWPDDRFDVVWTLTRTGDGWHFAQVPELVLPGDRQTVIEG